MNAGAFLADEHLRAVGLTFNTLATKAQCLVELLVRSDAQDTAAAEALARQIGAIADVAGEWCGAGVCLGAMRHGLLAEWFLPECLTGLVAGQRQQETEGRVHDVADEPPSTEQGTFDMDACSETQAAGRSKRGDAAARTACRYSRPLAGLSAQAVDDLLQGGGLHRGVDRIGTNSLTVRTDVEVADALETVKYTIDQVESMLRLLSESPNSDPLTQGVTVGAADLLRVALGNLAVVSAGLYDAGGTS